MDIRAWYRASFVRLDCDLYFALVTAMFYMQYHIDGLVQERRNSIALAMEFRLSCINPPMLYWIALQQY